MSKSSSVVPSSSSPFRLPTNIAPHHYDLVLVPDLTTFTFQGHILISLSILESTKVIECHSADLTFTNNPNHSYLIKNNSTTQDNNKNKLFPTSIELNDEFERVKINFNETLQPGDYTLALLFNGILNDKLCGFYRSKYTDLNGSTRYLAVTQFEATDARRAIPCWDEPGFKATFKVSLVVKQNQLTPYMTALSNMPVRSLTTIEKDNSNDPSNVERRGLIYPRGSRYYDFDVSPIMSSYLLAFFVGEVDCVTKLTNSGVAVNLFVPPTKAHLASFSLDTAVKCLEFFDSYFGIPYPLPKCDLIAIPDFAAGAMENWGLITYREVLLLVDPINSSAQVKQRCARVVAHEISHQWFGNLVTMNWWNNLWLNEGFARLMEHNAVAHIYPEWDIWSQFVSDTYALAQSADSMESSHPIQDDEVYTVDQINEQFDSISYAKGACVIRMLTHYLGEDKFMKGIQLYLQRHKYGNTITSDLWAALSEASGVNVQSIMNEWVTITGYPLVSVCEHHEHKNQVSLHQERFLSSGVDSKSAHHDNSAKVSSAPIWPIPILSQVYPLKGNAPYQFLLKEAKGVMTIDSLSAPSALKLNYSQSGFYRVSYTPGFVSSLSAAIGRKELPPIERLGVLRDVAALAACGRLGTEYLLDILVHFMYEEEFAVLVQMATSLSSLASVHGSEDSYYPSLQRFIASLFRHAFAVVGLSDAQGPTKHSHLNALSRGVCVEMLALADDDFVVKEGIIRLRAHVQATFSTDPNSTAALLPPDLRSSLYELCIRHYPEESREMLFRLYGATELSEEKIRLLKAIGHVSPSMNNPKFVNNKEAAIKEAETVAESILKFAFGDSVRTGDIVNIFIGLCSSRFGRKFAWNWTKSNFSILTDRFCKGAAFMIGGVLTAIISGFDSIEATEDFRSFFNKNPCSAADRAIKQAIEAVIIKTQRKEREMTVVKEWLLKHELIHLNPQGKSSSDNFQDLGLPSEVDISDYGQVSAHKE